VSHVESQKIEVYNENDKPYGITYGAWIVKWWQWIQSIPLSSNPLFDLIGEHWNTSQPKSDVWFLVGIFGGVGKTFPHRKIKMESGRSILIPVLNCEANSLEYPELKTHQDIKNHVINDVNTVVKKECIVDGTKIIPTRVPSDPTIFKITIPENNAFGFKNTGTTDASADGYWIFLKSLPRGIHNISFQGSCEFGRLNAGSDYELEIV
jgi:hypothetical protein